VAPRGKSIKPPGEPLNLFVRVLSNKGNCGKEEVQESHIFQHELIDEWK
jgi:hypothetical protein